MGLQRMINKLNRGYPLRCADPSQAAGYDKQIDRARVLEVRIHLPPAERCYGAGGKDGNFVAYINRWSAAMPQPNDLSRSLVALHFLSSYKQ